MYPRGGGGKEKAKLSYSRGLMVCVVHERERYLKDMFSVVNPKEPEGRGQA